MFLETTQLAFTCYSREWKQYNIEICLKLTIKKQKRGQWRLYCYLWTDFTHCCSVPILYSEQVNGNQ